MNTSVTTLFTAVVAVCASAVLALTLAEISDAAWPQQAVVIGKHLDAEVQTAQQIETLPRVVIVGRRADAPVQVASACTPQALC